MLVSNPAKPNPFPRPQSLFVEVPIQFGGNTEHLGYIDDSQISLYWFIHITDVHINSDENDTNLANFKEFLNYSYNRISPFTVINTGDMIMGQRSDSYVILSEKVMKEWTNYFGAVNSSPYATDPNPYRYLETPGNHDRNADWGARVYLNYTLAGQKHGTIQTFFSANFSRGAAAFSMLDTTPWAATPGSLGSEGHLDQADLDEYHRFLEFNKNSLNKFTFFHHPAVEAIGIAPTSLSPLPKTLFALNREYGVDISFFGHSHFHFLETFGQSAHIMGDRFKDSAEYLTTNTQEKNFYHIISVDNGGINFINVPLSADPQIVITNPSNPIFLTSRNPYRTTRGDGNIRTLVFTRENNTVAKVEYNLDGKEWKSMNPYNGTSRVLWESSRSVDETIPSDGKDHKIVVRVTMNDGKIYYQSAEATSKRKTQMVWELIFIALIAIPIAICLFVNRVKISSIWYTISNRKQKLTKIERKTIDLHKQQELSIQISYLAFSLLIFSFTIPWALLPVFQGGYGAVFSWGGVLSMRGIDWFVEAVVFTFGNIVAGLPILYSGIQKKSRGLVIFSSTIIFANTSYFMFRASIQYSAILFEPGFFIDLTLSIIIIVITLKETQIIKKMRNKIK